MRDLRRTLEQLDTGSVDRLVVLLDDARARGATIFIFGNGGSASTASHFACDLSKNTVKPDHERLRVIALNDSIPSLTAYANDLGYDMVFAEPLRVMGRGGDVAIGISFSGQSRNVLEAMAVARSLGMTSVALTGGSGGTLKDVVDLSVHVSETDIRRVEDVHLAICHAAHLALC